MEAALLVVVLLWLGTGYVGVKVIQRSTRRRADEPIPTARVTNAGGAEYAYQKSADLAKRSSRKIGKGLGISIGLVLISWPVLLIIWVFSGPGWDMQMGRKLRVRGREVLPPAVRGDGWSTVGTEHASASAAEHAPPSSLDIALPTRERDVIAGYWLLAARMEHASVPAFSRLSLQLAALGAPARLLRATHIAALDEIRHAETCFDIARALSGEAYDAGPIAELADESRTTNASPRLSLSTLAVESLVDGCLAEGIAADIAAHGAEIATEPAIRDALAMIARDEAAHAELAWTVIAWCLEVDRGHVGAALHGARLDAAAPTMPSGDRATLARYGIVSASESARIATDRCGAVRERLAALTASCTRLAVAGHGTGHRGRRVPDRLAGDRRDLVLPHESRLRRLLDRAQSLR